MANKPSILERAYFLARSGDYKTLERIASQLKMEGYEIVDAHLSAPSVKKELKALIKGMATD